MSARFGWIRLLPEPAAQIDSCISGVLFGGRSAEAKAVGSCHHTVLRGEAQIGPERLGPVGRFLVGLGMLVGGWPLLCGGVDVAAAEATEAQTGERAGRWDVQRIERRERHMGTEFAITAYGEDRAQVEAACDAAFARIAQLDARLSNYRSDSELSQLSHAAPHTTMVPVSDDLWRTLRAADEVSRLSGGAFDVTVGPLSKLWRHARRIDQWPSEERWQQARAAVGYRHIEYDLGAQAVRLTQPRMLLDLGGIAKGYALDEALEAMRRQGVPCALIDGGGDVAAGQAPPGTAGWRIGVANLGPDDGLGEVEIEQWLNVEHAAVATSGDRWQFVEFHGRRFSHLIDPRSGEPLSERHSVTVIAPTGMQADAWASALSVLEPDAGWAVIARLKSIEARLAQRRDGRLERRETSGFSRHQQPSLPRQTGP